MILNIYNTACFTGHRQIDPNYTNIRGEIWNLVMELYKKYGYTDYIVGGALGFDMIAAEVLGEINRFHPEHKIRYHVYVPCPDQTAKWRREDIARYDKIMDNAASFRCLSEKYTPDCMFIRNRAMVDASSLCIAYCYNTSRSGTASTVRYAMKSNKMLLFLPISGGLTEEDFR